MENDIRRNGSGCADPTAYKAIRNVMKEECRKKCGRPPKFNARTEQYRLRMNKEESFWLDQLCKREGLSKATALRKLVKMGYDMSKNGTFNGYPENNKADALNNVYPINEEDNNYY